MQLVYRCKDVEFGAAMYAACTQTCFWVASSSMFSIIEFKAIDQVAIFDYVRVCSRHADYVIGSLIVCMY